MATRRVSKLCFLLLSLFIASSCGVFSKEDGKYEKLKSEEVAIFHFSSRELVQIFFPKETIHDKIEPPVGNIPPPNTLITVTPDNPGLPGANPSTTPVPVPVPVPVPNTNPTPPQSTNPGTQPVMPNVPHNPGQSWCVAKSGAPQTALQAALDYACGVGGVDCSVVQQGGSCYNPVTLENHASYAFNSFYQRNPAPTSCDFGGTAVITTTNPSSGSCIFPASSSTSTSTSVPPPVTQTPTLTPPIPPAVPTPPAFPTPPAVPSPPAPAVPSPPATPSTFPSPPASPTPPASLRPSASPTPPGSSSGTAVPRASGSPVSANSTNNTTAGIPMNGFPNIFPIFNSSAAPDSAPSVTSMSKPRTLPQPFIEGIILLTFVATWNHI